MLGDGYVSEAHCAKVRMGGGGGEQREKNLFVLFWKTLKVFSDINGTLTPPNPISHQYLEAWEGRNFP